MYTYINVYTYMIYTYVCIRICVCVCVRRGHTFYAEYLPPTASYCPSLRGFVAFAVPTICWVSDRHARRHAGNLVDEGLRRGPRRSQR